MPTYTNLHNKIKENLTVGYSPEDRICSQKVRFYNNGNEYWGTFNGTFRAEQVDLSGGILKDVKIIGATLSDISWPGGIDFDSYGALIQAVSSEVYNIDNDKLPFAHQRITEEQAERIKEDGALRTLITTTDVRLSTFSEQIEDDIRRELCALKLDVTHSQRLLSIDLLDRSCDLSTTLDTKIDDVSAYFDKEIADLSTALSTQDENISVELHNRITEVESQLTQDVNFLSDELSTTQQNLAREIEIRARKDLALDGDIASLSSISDRRDEILQNNINALNEAAGLSVEQLSANIHNYVEQERHYKYANKATGLASIKSYPFELDDFAVNSFNFNAVDGQLYYVDDGDGDRHYVASIRRDGDEILVTPYKSNTSQDIKQAFDTSIIYSFSRSRPQIYIDSTAYNFTLEFPIGNDDINNYKFSLTPVADKYQRVRTTTQPIQNIGFVTKAYPPNSEDLLSGCLTIATDRDSEYSIFDNREFHAVDFNNTNLSVQTRNYNNLSLELKYNGQNNLELRHYHDSSYYLSLVDNYDGSNVGCIYDYYKNADGDNIRSIISTDFGIQSIAVWLDNPYKRTNPILLTRDNGFITDLDDDYIFSSGAHGKVQLTAVIGDNDRVSFRAGKESILYRYSFSGRKQDGTEGILGSIIPLVYNRTISVHDTDFDTIKADIKNIVYFNSLTAALETTPCELTKSTVPGENDVWYFTLVDDVNNILDVKYVGSEAELRLQITVRDVNSEKLGQIIAQKYKVNIADPIVVSGDDHIVTPLFTTPYVDVTTFDKEKKNFTAYNVKIDDEEEGDVRQSLNDFKTDVDGAEFYKAVVPARKSDNPNVMREFVLDILIDAAPEDIEFRKVLLVTEGGTPVDIINTTQSPDNQNYIFVQPNRRAIYAVREIEANKFAILDFNDEEDNHWIDVLVQKTDNLSTEILQLSTSLSSDIDSLSGNLSSEIETLSSNLSADLSSLSVRISTDIDLSVKNLQNQVISNDNDISSLSSILSTLSVNLSTDISCLSVNLSTDISALSSKTSVDIDELSSNLSALSGHYHTTLSADIQIPYEYTSTTGSTISKPLSVDQLLIVDEVTYERYRLTIRNGALNINKVDRLA